MENNIKTEKKPIEKTVIQKPQETKIIPPKNVEKFSQDNTNHLDIINKLKNPKEEVKKDE